MVDKLQGGWSQQRLNAGQWQLMQHATPTPWRSLGKSQKLIRLADCSNTGYLMVAEYQEDGLAEDSDDKKKKDREGGKECRKEVTKKGRELVKEKLQ